PGARSSCRSRAACRAAALPARPCPAIGNVHWIRGWGLERLLAADERAQALVLLAARGAAVEVRAQPGHRGVRVLAGELELDVPVELREALVAAELGPGGAEQPSERLLQVGPFAHLVSSSSHVSSAVPESRRCLRSFWRASCSVLYSAPRVVFKRSASTSIGTPFSASATSTRRWCGVRTSAIARWSADRSSLCSACSSGSSALLEKRLH